MAKENVRTRLSDAEADKVAAHYEKSHDLKGKEAASFWRLYGARRQAALAKDLKKHPKPKAKPKKAKGKAKGKAKKAA